MAFKAHLILIQIVFSVVLCELKTRCRYSACHPVDPHKLNIHLIPHSHDDLGWLKTVDQYLYGTRINTQRAGVQYILDSVVRSLLEDPDRRFIQVETAFFWMWWKHQDEDMKTKFKKLVNSGQLEIIGGGWSMNDEAVTNYQSTIDQFTLGFKTLQDTLGDCATPKIGWQIDPFGHSREMASIFAQLGFDAVFFPRIHYMDANTLMSDRRMEFIWRGQPDLGLKSDIFTNVMFSFYTSPDSFCFASTCKDEPIVDDEESPDYNLKERVITFANYVRQVSYYYKTNNVLIPMGGDFEYQSAHLQYKNMDRLIRGFKHFMPDEYNIIYSTPSCYIKAVNNYSEKHAFNYTIKTDDFLPYASNGYAYWTGFYTSRPTLKRFERLANNFLQIAKQLTVFERVEGRDYSKGLLKLKEIMGIMQHHDAITGTAKQHVTDDYVRLLNIGMKEAEKMIPRMIYNLLNKRASNAENYMLPFETCIMVNVSRCKPTQAKEFAAAVYNPLSSVISHYLQLPVTSTGFKIIDDEGNPVQYQISSTIETFPKVKFENTVSSNYTLIFRARDVPPLGLKVYYIYEDDSPNQPRLVKEDIFKFGNEKAGFEIDQNTGFMSAVTLNGFKIPMKQEFLYYSSSNGYGYGDSQPPSGAYAFRVSSKYPNARSIDAKVGVKAYTGTLFDEVHQYYTDSVKQIIRVYKEGNNIELDWIVGPLNYRDGHGVEVTSRFTSNLNTSDVFYADTNGRGGIKRTRKLHYPNGYGKSVPISPNYYPITSRISIKDEEQNIELAVINDRAQGGSSLCSGEIELMVHRRCKRDDGFFVDEVLNEMEYGYGVVVRGTHYLTLGRGEVIAQQQHELIQKTQLAPWTFVAAINPEKQHDRIQLKNQINFKFSGLVQELPPNIKLLTLETWDDSSVLLRLEHVYDRNEHPDLSKPASIDIKGLFSTFQIVSIKETTLGGDRLIAETHRLKWNLETGGSTLTRVHYESITEDTFNIVLKPMELRTFIVEVRSKIVGKNEELLHGDLKQLIELSTLCVLLLLLITICNRRARFYILKRLKVFNSCLRCIADRIRQTKHRP